MTWNLRKPMKHSASLAPSGSDGEKDSSQPSQIITNSPQNNEMHSSQFSLDPMIGLSLLNIHSHNPSNLYCSFTQEDINQYVSYIQSKRELLVKIQTIRNSMVETEKVYALGLISKNEYAASVSKLTVLFKSLLAFKERHAFSPHIHSVLVAAELPSHITL